MPHNQPNDIEDAIAFERQANAEELAATLIKLYGSPDEAEQMIAHMLKQREQADLDFWREVVTSLAQVRG